MARRIGLVPRPGGGTSPAGAAQHLVELHGAHEIEPGIGQGDRFVPRRGPGQGWAGRGGAPANREAQAANAGLSRRPILCEGTKLASCDHTRGGGGKPMPQCGIRGSVGVRQRYQPAASAHVSVRILIYNAFDIIADIMVTECFALSGTACHRVAEGVFHTAHLASLNGDRPDIGAEHALPRRETGAKDTVFMSDRALRDHSHRPAHLQALEAESIHILREVAAQAATPVLLYSIGKDSSVLLHLARKAFFPARPPFPLLHIDTTWKFRDMITFRDETASRYGFELRRHTNPEGLRQNVNPFDHDSGFYTQVMKTDALKQALTEGKYDIAIGGARRDEERSRAKERMFSVRGPGHTWDPKRQRPEL